MVKSKKNVLFAGCSLTGSCGFIEDNVKKFHWTHLISNHYGFNIKNIAIGGMSNEEIYFRTAEQIFQNAKKFDLVVIMWSGLNRKWVYFLDNNVDDFSIINHTYIAGNRHYEKSLQQYAKLHYQYFNNRYIDIKRFFLMIKMLETLLDASNTPYVFINGFDYEFDRLSKIVSITDLNSFNHDAKMFDFPSDVNGYILEKINELQDIMKTINKDKFLDSGTYSFYNNTVDLADDGEHPGIESNQQLANKLVKHIDNNHLLSARE